LVIGLFGKLADIGLRGKLFDIGLPGKLLVIGLPGKLLSTGLLTADLPYAGTSCRSMTVDSIKKAGLTRSTKVREKG
jgi:hypothetical protein